MNPIDSGGDAYNGYTLQPVFPYRHATYAYVLISRVRVIRTHELEIEKDLETHRLQCLKARRCSLRGLLDPVPLRKNHSDCSQVRCRQFASFLAVRKIRVAALLKRTLSATRDVVRAHGAVLADLLLDEHFFAATVLSASSNGSSSS